jgi:hypothetical protein
VSHAGLSLGHFETLDAEQMLQRPLSGPLALHAGEEAFGHGASDTASPLSPVHCTHVPVIFPQAGVATLHSATFVALHCVHMPPLQAGCEASGQTAVVPDPKSPLHAEQTPLDVSQVGFAAVLQADRWVAVHCEQRPAESQ